MNRQQIEYLESLARMDLRKKERSLEQAQRKEGQARADFEHFIARQTNRIAFIKIILNDLRAARNGGQ